MNVFRHLREMDSQEIYRSLGDRIRRYRKGIRLTQAQAAAQIGISRASLANIEAGRQQILVHHLYAIALALQLDSPEVLLASSTAARPREGTPSQLPLSEEGLTEKQRREVLRLMGGILDNNDADKKTEAK